MKTNTFTVLISYDDIHFNDDDIAKAITFALGHAQGHMRSVGSPTIGLVEATEPNVFGFTANDFAEQAEEMDIELDEEMQQSLFDFIEKRADAELGLNWDNICCHIRDWDSLFARPEDEDEDEDEDE